MFESIWFVCPVFADGFEGREPLQALETLVERHTRFAMLLKVPSKDTATVVAALGKHVRKLPQQLRRSLTWDRGKEMADHKSFTIATTVQVYFCDPRSPWQRGSNENTNGLLISIRSGLAPALRSAFAAIRTWTGRQNRLDRSKMTRNRPSNILKYIGRDLGFPFQTIKAKV
jgi:hypothetical protein